MLTVNTTEEGLGNGDGHVVAVALNIDSWSYKQVKNKVKVDGNEDGKF